MKMITMKKQKIQPLHLSIKNIQRDCTYCFSQVNYILESIVGKICCVLVSMYVLFYSGMMKTQARTVVISHIDPNKFEELYSKHGEILSCPCSTITTSYKSFVSNTIKFHPVCSSFFVSEQWAKALYLIDRSKYGVGDFRTTAASQVNQSNIFIIDIMFRTFENWRR